MSRLLVATLLCALLLPGCLEPWPIGDPRPGLRGDDDDGDDDDSGDDDDATGDDDDSTGDDDDSAGDDDDATGDDDDSTGDDDDTTGDDDDATGDDDDSTPPPIDADNDGYPLGTDCDDTDASINPGATDVHCDAIDQDCSGADICDICGGAVPLAASNIPGFVTSAPGFLGPPDQIYVAGADSNQYFFVAYELALPTLGTIELQYGSSSFPVWLEEWDAGCTTRQQFAGAEDAFSTTMDFIGLGGTVWIILSSYEPLDTGSYTFDIVNTTGT